MMLKVIIVSPKYQANLGYIARVSKNFGVKRIYFVRPRANLSGKKALMYAKHARELLANAKVYDGFDEAVRGCDVIIGTTGLWLRGMKLGRACSLEDAVTRIKERKMRARTVGLLIGRDDTGLTREELERCDIVASIAANREYPVLNVSHALAIFLYEFTKGGFSFYSAEREHDTPLDGEREMLFSVFEESIREKRIRNKTMVRRAFSKAVKDSGLTRQEIHALITALK